MRPGLARSRLEDMATAPAHSAQIFDELTPPLSRAPRRSSRPTAASSAAARTPTPRASMPARPGSTCRRFVAAIARGEPDERSADRSSPRTCSAAPARACARSSSCARAHASCTTKGGSRSRSARCSATRPTSRSRPDAAASDARSPLQLAPRRRDRRRTRRARLRRRARRARLRRHGLRRADEPGGLVRYAIAPYRSARPAARGGAGARRARRRTSSSASRSTRRGARCSRRGRRRGRARGRPRARHRRVATPATTSPGVWESLPFIEAIKTGELPERRRHSRRDRRGQHRDRRRARGGSARRRRRHARSTAAPRPRCPPIRTRSPRRATRACGSSGSTAPVRFLGAGRVCEAIECRRMRARRARRERPRAPGGGAAEPSSSLPADTVVKAIGQRPRTEFLQPGSTALELDRGTVVVDPMTGQTGNPRVLRGRRRDQRRRDASSRPCATAKRAARGDRRVARARLGMTEIRWHARAGQGAKTASQLLATALLRDGQERAGFPRVRARAARRAAARVHARRRHADPAPRRDHATPTSSSCSSPRCCARSTSRRTRARTASSCSTPTSAAAELAASACAAFRRAARRRASKFVNLVHGRRARGRARRAALETSSGRGGRAARARRSPATSSVPRSRRGTHA